MKKGRHFILVYTLTGKGDQQYEVFEKYKNINKRYKEILKWDNLYSASICAVVKSTDYEPHPKFQ